MGMFKKVICCFLLFIHISADVQAGDFTTAKRVLDYLFQTNGNKILIKPNIEIIKSETDAARYIKRTNTIQIGEKAIQLCRNFGKDSLSALGFVIGHELIHSFQTDLNAKAITSFMAYDNNPKSDSKIEEDADVQGIFICYLAGYKTISIVPQVIEKMYEAYGMNKQKLNGYPSFEDRKLSALKIQAKVTQLVQLYEIGCQLAALGQHELAIANFQYIEQYYKGRELYNNLGVCYALQALNVSDTNTEQFIFPFELEWNTRLKKPSTSRGDEDEMKALALRKKYLDRAEKYFLQANKLDFTYFNAEINLFCTYVLNEKYEKAALYVVKSPITKRAELFGASKNDELRAELTTALYYAAIHDNTKATAIWESIATESSMWAKSQAQHNLQILQKEKIITETTSCQLPEYMTAIVDDVLLHRSKGSDWIEISKEIKVSIEQKNKSNVVLFKKENRIIFAMQRVFTDQKTKETDIDFGYNQPNFTLTTKGSFRICPESNVLEHISVKEDLITEWVKYSKML
jgi:hypothetical protein